MITVGSLFAGIGGFDLGLERAGMRVQWQVEIDEYCRAVLAKHWPDVKRFEDVRNVGRNELEPVDLICGGFPCQPHSLAGKRQGAADDRDLWPEYRRLIAELRPRWVLGENVLGIRTTILDEVLSDLESLDYTWATFVVPAVAFDAQHRRDRVWIVAHTASQRPGRRDNGDEAGNERPLQVKRSRTAHQPPHVAHAEGKRTGHECQNGGQGRGEVNALNDSGGTSRGHDRPGDGSIMAHAQKGAERAGLRQGQPGGQRRRRFGDEGSQNGTGPAQPRLGGMADGLPYQLDGPDGARWQPEPDIPRVATGVPDRVNRLKALGNAVVPAVVEWLGRMIIEADQF